MFKEFWKSANRHLNFNVKADEKEFEFDFPALLKDGETMTIQYVIVNNEITECYAVDTNGNIYEGKEVDELG